VTAAPEDNLGSRLTQEQAITLDSLIERMSGVNKGWRIIETEDRIRTSWEIYLRLIQSEAEAAADPAKRIKKGSTATTRRDLLRTLKLDLGRLAQVEDLLSLYPTLEFDPEIVNLLREDITRLQQRAPRRTKAEVRAEQLSKLQGRLSKALGGTKKAAAKKSSKK
jgi:hypothetical protein